MLTKCRELSDHPIAFDYHYDEILQTARELPPETLFCEIGTRAGGSALMALLAIRESGVPHTLLTIDPYGEKPFENRDETHHRLYGDALYRAAMRELTAFCDQYNLDHIHYKMTSEDFIATFEQTHLWKAAGVLGQETGHSFGYVYLDGEHNPCAVTMELDYFLPRMAPGGLVVIDDIENIQGTDSALLNKILAESIVKGNRSFYRKPGGAARSATRDTLVFTIAIGEDYQRLAAVTHPRMRAYAERIGADFMAVTAPQIATTTPHWEKFQIYGLLQGYQRILYLDTDILLRDDCPDFFALVPPHKFGAFNEAPFTDRSRELLIDTCKAYGVTLPDWDGRYFNSGVMVISREHAAVFEKPKMERFSFFEQTYLNMRLAELGIEMHELPYTLNRMSCVDACTGEHRLAAHVVHYAGAPTTDAVIGMAQRDAETWQRMRGRYRFKRHIHVLVTGGLGDQICAEPALRFMKEHVYPDAAIAVSTHFPELFAHLDVDVYPHGEFKPKADTPYWTVNTHPSPETMTWAVVSNLLCHTVDFCSISLLRRTLPLPDRTIRLQIEKADEEYLDYLFGHAALGALTLVHAGRHWNTKTFPVEWWQAVVDGLAARGAAVCLIGQDDETRGVLPLHCPSFMFDLRNRLTLGQLMALIKHAPVLVSNDSAPVHIAGAFDNNIVLIPSCKHPDHILPYRNGSPYYKATALYKRLTLDAVSSQPTEIHGSSAEFEVADWSAYLPEPSEVVDTTLSTRTWGG